MRVHSILQLTSTICILILIFNSGLKATLIGHFKNIFYNLHQNYLIIIALLLKRIARKFDSNTWVSKLEYVVTSKQVSMIEGEEDFMIKESNGLTISMLKLLITNNFSNRQDYQYYLSLTDIINNIEKYTYDSVKGIVYNLVFCLK